MIAAEGDWLVVQPRHVGDHGRRGLVLDVRGPSGGPPYLVRWTDTDHEALVFPGPDAGIEKSGSAAWASRRRTTP
jgi:Domain of unknown function (DUF1918)